MGNDYQKVRPGTKELVIALESETDFESIVEYLKTTLVVPEQPGITGCHPCLSGLDRILIQNTVIDQLR